MDGIVYRSEKGELLTSAEVDGNFRILSDAVDERIPVCPPEDIPVDDAGPLFVEGEGLREYSDFYHRYLSVVPAHGQCRLEYASDTMLRLAQYNGDKVVVNGVTRSIPASGIQISSAGLSVGGTYFFYLYDSNGTLAIESSTEMYTRWNNGLYIKGGTTPDYTRTLVGKASISSFNTFFMTGSDKRVASFFNRRRQSINTHIAGVSFTATSDALVTGMNGTIIAWPGDAVDYVFSGYGTANSNVAGVALTLYLGGTSTGRVVAFTVPGVNYSQPFAHHYTGVAVTESTFNVQVYGRCTGSGYTSTISNADMSAMAMI